MTQRGTIRIDLEWAKQRIYGFEKRMAEVAAVKASENEYKKLFKGTRHAEAGC